MSVWTIVVAGGSGARFGGAKQFEQIAGRTVLARSVAAAGSVSEGIVVVLPAGESLPSDVIAEPASSLVTASGGPTRAASVRAGLALVPPEARVVVVHDAARPLASPALFAAVVAAVRGGAGVALPAVPLTDTIRRVGGGVVDRRDLLAVQTPQACRADLLRAAHRGDAEATDDASLIEALGGRVDVVEGEATNLKITHPADLAVAAALVAGESPTPLPSEEEAAMEIRVGQGFDVHRFAPAGDEKAAPSGSTSPVLVLGGARFEGHRPLVGHSDADAIAHAVTDALLGAAGLGDIGQLFPDTDPALAGADSIGLLAAAVHEVRRAGWRVANVDCTVVTESPKLSPRKAEIEGRLSEVVGGPVTVKGKRAEGLGSLGRQEGLACWAVAIVTRSAPR